MELRRPRPPERRRIGRHRIGLERRRRTQSGGLEDFSSVEREYDGHRTYQEREEKGTFWGAIAEDIAAVEPPTGFQGLISWLFLPVVAAGTYLDVRVEYLYIGAALLTVVFCIIEMDKPDKPHNLSPRYTPWKEEPVIS
ncbi:hypothetical protein NL676_021891 [Syzygium grande]|nr:hypothetical protein NL676_021891 [Syzygium grande]